MANCGVICLFVCLFVTCVYAQVSSLCRPNERLLPCGCPKACKDPAPNCEGVCQMGCFCEEGEVRNNTGHCVKLADCPPYSSITKLDTSEPRLHDGDCPENEEYRFCEPCLKTCDNPNPVCPAQCSRGCFCKEHLLRDKNGRCVPFHECSNFLDLITKKDTRITITLETTKPRIQHPDRGDDCPENEEYRFCDTCVRTCATPNPKCPAECSKGCFCKGNLLRDKDGKCVRFHECSNFLDYIQSREKNYVEPVPYRFTCGPKQVYKECEKCIRSCNDAVPVCGMKCKTGCFCKDGLVKGPDGTCMRLEECPKENSIAPVPYPFTCGPNQVYKECEKCTRSCSDAEPVCGLKCKTGCFCRDGLVKGPDGTCMRIEECSKESSIAPVPYPFTCGPNQVYKECEKCIRSCNDAVPVCGMKCKTGCFCKDGLVKGPDGTCMRLEECPKENSIAPVPYRYSCGPNQVYKECEKCTRSCSDVEPVCGMKCKTGCFCKDGLVKGPDGTCMRLEECPKESNVDPVPYRFTCGSNQVYKECEKCTRSCSDAEPVCGMKCKTGCFCKDGLVKGPDGTCMKIEECPKAATSISIHSASSVEVEDCTSGEEFFSCGWCEPTCSEPHPFCPSGCTRGCLCRPPLLRHASGKCVTKDQCEPKQCSKNEIYVCRSGCESTCSGVPCVSRPRRCTLGCYCKLGYLRNERGQCVTFELCLEEHATQRLVED